MLLATTAAVVLVMAAQGPVTVRSAYLDAVRQYGPGTEAAALAALAAVPPLDADQVLLEWFQKSRIRDRELRLAHGSCGT
jgi:hypothetical protein